jgi:hypothetical protein
MNAAMSAGTMPKPRGHAATSARGSLMLKLPRDNAQAEQREHSGWSGRALARSSIRNCEGRK